MDDSDFYELGRADERIALSVHEAVMDEEDEYGRGYRVERSECDVDVTLLYPGVEGHPSGVTVDMEHVRACGCYLRIDYDFDRDGWRVTRVDETTDPTSFREVAFVEAWEGEEDSGNGP